MELFPVPDNLPTHEYLFLASMASEANRSFEMTKFTEKLVVKSSAAGSDLTTSQQTLLLTSFKNAIIPILSSWHSVDFTVKRLTDPDEVTLQLTADYLGHVASELNDRCQRYLEMVDEYLMRLASDNASKVIYLVIKGDCHGYMAELMKGQSRKDEAAKAMDIYTEAQEIAISNLPPSHHGRLILANSISRLYCEVLKNVDQGYSVAKQAFEDALPGLGSQSDADISRTILKILMNNLTKWRPSVQVCEIPE